MQTFLPYPSFEKSAKCLDSQRLGKQRIEVLQLLRALTGQSKGWVNHPACKMWKGYESGLAVYGLWVCREWTKRGYKDTCSEKIRDILVELSQGSLQLSPKWLGDEAFHASHRSNLLRKDEAFYRQYGWTEPTDLPYIWPTNNNH